MSYQNIPTQCNNFMPIKVQKMQAGANQRTQEGETDNTIEGLAKRAAKIIIEAAIQNLADNGSR